MNGHILVHTHSHTKIAQINKLRGKREGEKEIKWYKEVNISNEDQTVRTTKM